MKSFALTSLIVFSLAAYAGPPEGDTEIVSSLFNGDLDHSNSLIDAQIISHPESPKYYFLKAHHAFYSRYFAPLSRDSVLQVIIDYSLKAVESGKQSEPTIENKFYVGSAYGLLSRAYIMRQEVWDAYWAGRDCRNYLEEVIEEDPEYYDAYVALGVIEYYPDQLTGFQAGLAWLGGMSGDREKGLDYFARSARNGTLLKAEAMFVLAYVYRFVEIDFSEANNYFSRLNEEYPGNEFFATHYRQTSLARAIEENGVGVLDQETETLTSTYSITNSGVLNGLGYSFIGKQEHQIAMALFERNISLYPDQANPYDSIAECCMIMGNTELALQYSKLCLEKLATDETIDDEFRETLRELNEDRLKELGKPAGV